MIDPVLNTKSSQTLKSMWNEWGCSEKCPPLPCNNVKDQLKARVVSIQGNRNCKMNLLFHIFYIFKCLKWFLRALS